MAEFRVGSSVIQLPLYVIERAVSDPSQIMPMGFIDGVGRKFVAVFKEFDLARLHIRQSRATEVDAVRFDDLKPLRVTLDRARSEGIKDVWFDFFISGPTQEGTHVAISDVIEGIDADLP